MLFTIVLSLSFALFAAPQEPPKLERPADWKVRLDHPTADASKIYFVTMPPGWHITTGPAAILYNPTRTAKGNYRLEATIFLFPPEPGRLEAYGVFYGGSDLEGDAQSYDYFLIRNDGRYLIKRREGESTKEIVPWTEHAAIQKHSGEKGKTARNVLAVAAGESGVDFLINGQKVTTLARSACKVDGLVGLRVNHSLDLHVSELTVK